MNRDISIRLARREEQPALESLQRRASLSNPGDRDALLAHPEAIALPVEQIVAGSVFVAERDGTVAGFAAVVPRPDGGADLDALFVEPHLWKQGIGRRLVEHAADVARAGPPPSCTSLATRTRKPSTCPAASTLQEPSKHDLERAST